MTRINKFVAQASGLARREADEAISAGRVQINGQPASLGAQVNENDRVELDGKVIKLQTNIFVLLNKPVGYVSSRRQQGETPTLYELLPAEYQQLKIVGRLDQDSSGLVLLTNDGDTAHELTHPKFGKQKIYEVTLDIALRDQDQQAIEQGVALEDGSSSFEIKHQGENRYQITMHEGRNRQIRRTFAALGYNVVALHRLQMGDYKLGDLATGKYREL